MVSGEGETALMPFQPIVPTGPARSVTEAAPETYLKGRYKLNEPINEATSVVFATDMKSLKPQKLLKVMVKVYHARFEYKEDVDTFSKLRSEFVAALIDHWEDDESGRYYIVLERGTVRLDEHVLFKKRKVSPDDTRKILGNLASAALFLLHNNYYCDLQLENFMDYGNKWKICSLYGIRKRNKHGPYQHPLHCFGADESIMNGSLKTLETMPFTTFNLGMLVLELLMMDPMLKDRRHEDIVGIGGLTDEKIEYLQLPREEEDVVRAVKEIITAPELLGHAKILLGRRPVERDFFPQRSKQYIVLSEQASSFSWASSHHDTSNS